MTDLDLDAIKARQGQRIISKDWGDIDALVAEVEALRAENETLRGPRWYDMVHQHGEAMAQRYHESACVYQQERDTLTARIEAALALCHEMPPAFWQLYEGGTLDRVRAALSPQEEA